MGLGACRKGGAWPKRSWQHGVHPGGAGHVEQHREWTWCVWGGWHVCGMGQGPVQEGGAHPDRAGPLLRGLSGVGPFGVAAACQRGLGHMGGGCQPLV